MSKLAENLKKMIDILYEYRQYSPYYRKMAMVFLFLEVLSYITLFSKGNPGKLGAIVALFALILFPVMIYYIVRMTIDIIKTGKNTFVKGDVNKFLIFYDFIYIFVFFLDPILRKLVGKLF